MTVVMNRSNLGVPNRLSQRGTIVGGRFLIGAKSLDYKLIAIPSSSKFMIFGEEEDCYFTGKDIQNVFQRFKVIEKENAELREQLVELTKVYNSINEMLSYHPDFKGEQFQKANEEWQKQTTKIESRKKNNKESKNTNNEV